MPENRPYGLLARYYDQLFTSQLGWQRQARREILREILPTVQSACDLACGTGTAAIELWRRGIKVFAVDLSPTMCRLARLNARQAGAHIRVIRGDMRTFRLPERVDLITCEYDAVNHLAQKSYLVRTAKAVARALRAGGFFYFDVNRRRHLEKNWPGTHWAEESGVVMIMRGSYDRRRAKGCLDLEWFVRENTCWRRSHEHIEQVWWTDEEIRQSLREAGFGQIQSWDARQFSPRGSMARGIRTFYLARLGA